MTLDEMRNVRRMEFHCNLLQLKTVKATKTREEYLAVAEFLKETRERLVSVDGDTGLPEVPDVYDRS